MIKGDLTMNTRTPVQMIPSLLIVLLLAFFSVNKVHAQDFPVNLEGRGGIAIPIGDLADVANVGADFGLKASYFFSPYFEVRGDGEVEILPGKGSAPNMRLWHYTVGPGVKLTDASVTPWSVIINGGLGITTIDTDHFQGNSFNDTYFALNFGAKVGYDVTRQVDIFVSSIGYITFANKNSTRFFAGIPGGKAFDTVFSLPVTAGVTVRI